MKFNSFLFFAAVAAGVGFAGDSRMDRAKLQIGAYCLAPYARTEAHVRDLASCGIDFVYGVPASDRATLDLCAKYGVGVIATGAVPFWHGMGGEQAGQMKSLRPIGSYAKALESYRDHPAIWLVDYVDEPSALDFGTIGEVTRFLQAKLPKGVTPYINLYPNYASVVGNTAAQTVNQLGTRTYREHVEAYARDVPVDYLCFDFYLYSARGKNRPLKLAKFYENLEDAAAVCRATGKSLWYIPQVNSSYGELWLSENMLRFQAYLAMAYGAEQIDWACWSRENRDEDADMPGLIGWWTNNVLTLTGEKTEQYAKLKTVNAELHRLGERYMKYRTVATRRIGEGSFVVGDMVARDGSGKRAMFVVASSDPFDEAPSSSRFSFCAASARAFGGAGEMAVERDAEGSLSIELKTNAAALIEYEPLFRAAECVWHEGHARELNEQLRFRGTFSAQRGERTILRLASFNPYRVTVNGQFAWYGPSRGPKGYARVDEVPLAVRDGENVVEIACAGSNCANFYFQKQPSFIEAEVEKGGAIVLRTTAQRGKGNAFVATLTDRVRPVSRYSHARAFGEAYRVGAADERPLPLERMPDVPLLPRHAAPPDFSMADDFAPIAEGSCVYDEACATKKNGFVENAGTPAMDGYRKSELKYDLWDDQQRFRFTKESTPKKSARYPLADGRGLFFVAPLNRTGFPHLAVVCHEPGELHVLFDEYPVEGDFKPWRSVVANDIVWRFEKPGTYEVEAFEPYVLKAIEVAARGGRFEIAAPSLRLYRNAQSRQAAFQSSDPELNALFAAAEENFAQNAVDGFLDCPGRERAGWNCDSYFTSRASALLTGNLAQETLFLSNFAIPPDFDNVARGMIPMCYPSDFANGNYIPSWAMFFVLELDEYARLRGGKGDLVALLRPRVFALVEFLSKYRNAEGLLENLPRWVFVEWSKANDFVKGVNFPNNMIWAATLEAVDRLYGRPDLAAEAQRVKAAIRRLGWSGEWFRDQALRQADGSLKVTPESSETCQYYAFYFGTATREGYPELYRRLTTEFGPERRSRGLYPKIWESAPFIGNFMRLDWLGREGLVARECAELKGYFGFMASRTGTLWENADSANNGSCCHGFASHAAVFLLRDVLGLRKIDVQKKRVQFAPPRDLPLKYCRATLPVGQERLTFGWQQTGNEQTKTLPAGWREDSHTSD